MAIALPLSYVTLNRCRCASRWTARQERAAEGATRAVGARRGLRRHCRRRVDNVTRASNEQRMAGGCSDDGGGDVVAWTAGSGRCDKTRRIRRTMRQHETETADDGTSAGGDEDGIILSNYYYYLILSSAACLRCDLVRLVLSHCPPPAVHATTLPPPSSLQPPAVRCSLLALVTLSTCRRQCHRDPLLAPTALVAPSAARSRRAVRPLARQHPPCHCRC